ncbi:hypothetical protein GOP47_0011158 [Adiantum capillus-veneris]|uniref:Uncharacterized protein n=1 Tax=Adiantum capillus-veneris TaxID=13818 RepID=A0A9D4USM7_ADICA|nr:hypothetical protein GOP47_0011158 [Adiantum capillus-veneris]
MGASVGTAPWSLGVSLTGQPALRHSSRSRPLVSVPLSLSFPRLVTAAAAAAATSQVAADAPPASSPPLASPPSPSSVEDEEGGPIQLPDSGDPLSFTSEKITPLQSAASILLTGIIAVLLYRSLRRRMKLAKEMKVRSTGLENINEAPKNASVVIEKTEKTMAKAPLTAWQTFQGAVIAGAIAFVLYRFATYVEAGFALKPVSNVYTIRQLTITVRTILNGMCYLATFVFAANSLGLSVYTLQLLLNLGSNETTQKGDDKRLADQDPVQTDTLEEVTKE